jgi:hypothetical protein
MLNRQSMQVKDMTVTEKEMTQRELLDAMTREGPARVRILGLDGILQSVQREDGSGRSFNVTVLTKDGEKVFYFRFVSGGLPGTIILAK